MKNYLLFDLDGTLTDPKEGICTCVQYALSAMGIEEPDLDKLEPFIGPPLKDSFQEFYHMSEEQAQAAVEKYRERFQDKGIFENKLYPGIPEMLRALNSKGMFLGVASSKPTVFVKKILEHFEIARYFKVIVGSELDGPRTNKDEVVAEALQQLFGDKPVERDKVYMIGDRRFDTEGARAQGVESVGVAYGYGSMEELKEARTDYIVRSVEELQKFLLRGTEEAKKLTPSQRIWQLALPFLLFLLVRNLAMNMMNMLFEFVGTSVKGWPFLFIRDEAGTLTGYTGNAATIMSAVGFVAGAISVKTIARKVLARAKEDRKLLHIKGEPVANYAFLVMVTVGAVLGLNLLLELVGITKSSAVYQEIQKDQYSAVFLLGFVCYSLVAPIAEELLFRGIIYNCLRRSMKPVAALVISAAFFGMYHGNSVQGIYAFVIGLLLAYAYEYFGSFWVPVGIHMAANALAYCLANTAIATSAAFVSWPVCILFLVLAGGGFYLLNRQKRVF